MKLFSTLRTAFLCGAAAGTLAMPPGVEAQGALRSGPQIGARPLPFTSNMVTGPQRGKQFCYV